MSSVIDKQMIYSESIMRPKTINRIPLVLDVKFDDYYYLYRIQVYENYVLYPSNKKDK